VSDPTNDKPGLMPNDIPFPEVVKRAAPLIPKSNQGNDEEGPPLEEGLAQLALFEGIEIRKIFHDGDWYFSVTDVIGAITATDSPRRYWSDLKRKLHETEGFVELYDEIVQLRMEAADGKLYLTDTATAETLLRIIQSVPHKKAEPFKRWLAKVGYERIQETQDPEIAVKRAILNWQAQGRTNDWIEARLRSIVVRKDLTDEWHRRGVEEGVQYARLTNVISKETFGLDTSQHKQLKGLTKQNLRDHMTDLELVFTMLGEKSTAAIAQATDAQGFFRNAQAAQSGGKVAGDARKELERKLKRSVVSRDNFLETSRKSDPQKLTRQGNGPNK
jgi:DNA-damage-inducible protein D